MKFYYSETEIGDTGTGLEDEQLTPPAEKTYPKKVLDAARAAERAAKSEAAELRKKLEEIEAAEAERKANAEGDYKKLKEQLLSDNAKLKEEKDRLAAEKEQAIADLTAKQQNQLKRLSLKAAFAGVFVSEAIEDLLANSSYYKHLQVVDSSDGGYEVIVIDPADGEQRYKSVKGKSIPFTVDDLADELAEKKPTIAKAQNRSSGGGENPRNVRAPKGVDPTKLTPLQRIELGRKLGTG